MFGNHQAGAACVMSYLLINRATSTDLRWRSFLSTCLVSILIAGDSSKFSSGFHVVLEQYDRSPVISVSFQVH